MASVWFINYEYKLIKTRGVEDYFIQALAIAFIMFDYVA
jgi:hypothetical protein